MKLLKLECFRASVEVELADGKVYTLPARTVQDVIDKEPIPNTLPESAALLAKKMKAPVKVLNGLDAKQLGILGKFYFTGKYPDEAEETEEKGKN